MERTILFGFDRDRREVVRVSAPGGVSVARVVEEVAARCGVGLTGDLAIWRSRLGDEPDPLHPEAAFATAGVHSGDGILVVPSSSRPAPVPAGAAAAGPAVLDLVAVGGARSGTRMPLHVGLNRVAGVDLEVSRDGTVTAVPHAGGARPRIDGRVVGRRGAPLRAGAWLRCGPEVFTLRLPHGTRALAPGAAPGEGHRRPPRVRMPQPPPPYQLPDVPGGPERSAVPLGAVLAPALIAVVAAAVMANPVYLIFGALSPMVGGWRLVSDRRRGRRRFRLAVRDFRSALSRAGSDLAAMHAAGLAARRAAAPDADSLVGRALRNRSTLWERRRQDEDFLVVRVGVGDLPTRLETTPGASSPSSPETLLAQLRAIVDAHRQDLCVPVTVDLGGGGGAMLGIAGEREVTDALAAAMVLQIAVLHSPDEVDLSVIGGEDHTAAWDWTLMLPHHMPWGADLRWGGSPGAAGSPALLGRGRHRVVVVVGEPGAAARDALMDAAGTGVSIVWCATSRDRLPERCGSVLVTTSSASGRLVAGDDDPVDLIPDSARLVDSAAVARVLAALGDATDRAVRAVPPRAGLCETLAEFNCADPLSPEEVRGLWQRSRRRSLTAVIGAGAGSLVGVDLETDGPHALVVGTTGSGKSELFSTLLVSLAVGTSAEHLAFLLVDFKGGAAFDRLAPLPHTAGVVTDLDGPLADRVLASLEAELRRRMELLRSLGVGDLAGCERTRPAAAPPRLVVVVDEFAALAREVPGFVDGLVDVARRGRSLGVHLLVGTQQPDAGTAKLRDNTNLRVCLRVQDPAVSREIVGVPDASQFTTAMGGRAIVRRGHGEAVAVQTAWGGSPAGHDGRLAIDILRHGRGGPGRAAGDPDRGGEQGSELEAVVAAVVDAWMVGPDHDPHPHRIWVPPPPELVPLEGLERGTPDAPVVGIADDTRMQRLAPMTLDLAKWASVLVTGRSGSGRTTFLRTLAAALARAGSPEEIAIYALDFGDGSLGDLDALPHCAGVVSAGEDERVDRLFAVLAAEMTRRTSDPLLRCPRVVLLLDGFGAFAAAHEDWTGGHVETLRRLCEDGRGLGLHVVVAGDPASVRARVLEAFGAIVELTTPGDARGPAGRVWRVATAAPISPGATATAPSRMPAIEELPMQVDLADLKGGEPGVVPLGLDAETREPAGWRIVQVPLFLVAGPMRSGRSTTLATAASGMGSARKVLLAPRRGPLPGSDCWDEVSVGPEACHLAAAGLADEVRLRVEAGAACDDEALAIFVDDAEALAEGPAATALEEVARMSWEGGVHLVVAAEAHAAARSYGWLMQMRVCRNGVILQADSELDSEIFRLRLPRRPRCTVTPGRGELVSGGEVRLIQVARGPLW